MYWIILILAGLCKVACHILVVVFPYHAYLIDYRT